MSANFKPQAIRARSHLTNVRPGQIVETAKGRIGTVAHPYTDDNGIRKAWIKWQGGTKGVCVVADLY